VVTSISRVDKSCGLGSANQPLVRGVREEDKQNGYGDACDKPFDSIQFLNGTNRTTAREGRNSLYFFTEFLGDEILEV